MTSVPTVANLSVDISDLARSETFPAAEMGDSAGPQLGPPAHIGRLLGYWNLTSVMLIVVGINFTPTIHHDTYAAIDTWRSIGISGKHVFVTGASRGLGRAMAIAYAKAGASVIGIAARSGLDKVKKDIENAALSVGKAKPNVVAVAIDVMKPESVQQAVEKIMPHFQNRLDILVCSAGYMEVWRPIADADIEDWWNSWDVNVKGQVLVWKAMLPILLADESSLKTIVNLSSIGAHMSTPGGSAYQTTKFALLRLTEFLNAEYGDKGLIAYCMHPGAVKTDLAGKMPEMLQKKLIDTPELMSDTVVYLTQQRREWLRGRYLSCNWDMQEMFAMQKKIVEKDLLKMRMAV